MWCSKKRSAARQREVYNAPFQIFCIFIVSYIVFFFTTKNTFFTPKNYDDLFENTLFTPKNSYFFSNPPGFSDSLFSVSLLYQMFYQMSCMTLSLQQKT